MSHKAKTKQGKAKIAKVLREFKNGELKSSSGSRVKSRKQAVAIALSESRRVGHKKKGK